MGGGGKREIIHLSLHCHHKTMSTNYTFLKRKKNRSGIEPWYLPLTSLPSYHLAKDLYRSMAVSSSLPILMQELFWW